MGVLYMRKLTLLLAVLALAATSSVADAKKSKKAAAAPAAAKQEMPGAPGAKVFAGYFREVGKIGQPAPAPAAKKGKKK